MCDFGIDPEYFNPRVLYIIKRKYNSDNIMPYHAHDFISLIYIVSGSCTYKINDHLYHVKKGDLIVCNPGVYHGKIIDPPEEIIEYHVGINNICIEGIPRNYLIHESTCPLINLGKYEQDFFKCFNDILLEQEKNEPGRNLMLKCLVMKLLVILLKCVNSEEDVDSYNSGLNFETYDKNIIVNAIVSFINENYMKQVSLDKISKNMYLSTVYISKVFKEELGDSPINYLIKVRLSKARELLESGNLSVKAVAESVGYNDAYHFSKLFKKYYGCPPSSIRK